MTDMGENTPPKTETLQEPHENVLDTPITDDFLQDMGDNLFLEGPESFKAEDFFQDGLRTIHGYIH